MGLQVPDYEAKYDLEHAWKTFMEEKKSFIDASILGIKDMLDKEMDCSMLMTFVETCMNLLCDIQAMMRLQEHTNRCIRNPEGEFLMVQKIRKHKARIGKEMRILTKQTVEQMGRTTMQQYLIQ